MMKKFLRLLMQTEELIFCKQIGKLLQILPRYHLVMRSGVVYLLVKGSDFT